MNDYFKVIKLQKKITKKQRDEKEIKRKDERKKSSTKSDRIQSCYFKLV